MPLSEVLRMRQTIEAIKARGAQLPFKVSYRLGRLNSRLEKIAADYEKVRVEMVKKYGEEDEKGDLQVSPQSEQYPEFAAELTQLLETQETIRIPSFQLEEFEESKGLPVEFFEVFGEYIAEGAAPR